jgi:hypothetical protein
MTGLLAERTLADHTSDAAGWRTAPRASPTRGLGGLALSNPRSIVRSESRNTIAKPNALLA